MKKLFILSVFASAAMTAAAQTYGASFPFNFDDGYTILHSNAKVKILVKNDGATPIRSLAYIIEDFNSGAVSSEKTVTLDADLPASEMAKVTFKIPAGSEIGVCQKILTITKVNGEKNEISEVNATAFGNIHTFSEKVAKKTIEEEYTGTWCGNCPRGLVGMEMLSEKYPDSFVGIAYHYSDPMQNATNPIHENGFPEAVLNRVANIDAYYGNTGNVPFGIEEAFLDMQNILPEASLETHAVWADEQRSQIAIESRVRFVTNSEDRYAMGYAVTEDGQHGTGSSWAQCNYYTGNAEIKDDPNMAIWYNGSGYVSGITYNHVAILSDHFFSGIDGSIASPVSVDMQQTHTYTLDLSSATTIQDRDRLHLVAILINTTTGKIINSDSVHLSAATEGLHTVLAPADTTTSVPSASFAADGRQVRSYPGITIQADGKKVLR